MSKCYKIKPVNSKENQPWILIGRTDAEAPIFWPPDTKNWPLEKILILKSLRAREKEGDRGWEGWVASLTQRTCESETEVAQSYLALCNPMDFIAYQAPLSAHGILKVRVLEWVAISFSGGSSRPRDRTQVSHTVRQMLLPSEPPGKSMTLRIFLGIVKDREA